MTVRAVLGGGVAIPGMPVGRGPRGKTGEPAAQLVPAGFRVFGVDGEDREGRAVEEFVDGVMNLLDASPQGALAAGFLSDRLRPFEDQPDIPEPDVRGRLCQGVTSPGARRSADHPRLAQGRQQLGHEGPLEAAGICDVGGRHPTGGRTSPQLGEVANGCDRGYGT